MHFNLLTILLIGTTATAVVIPNTDAEDLCIDRERFNKLEKEVKAECPGNSTYHLL